MAANYDLPAVVEKRVRFFDGQYLQDQDFVDEQKYHLDRERRHLRLLHVAGIAEGLAVARAGEPNKVTVAPGTAIDSDGRQLVLAQAATVDLPAERFNDKQGIELYIGYRESAEDQQTEAGSRDFTRWLERPQLTPIAPGETYAGTTPPVLLARLALDNAGRVTVDETVRAYSGVRLPGPAADAPTLRSTAGGQVHLAGSLTVDGNVGIGVTDPRRPLHVEGAEIHSGGGGAGFSFADRAAGSFVDSPANGQRWAWYAMDGTARLWSGGDTLSVTPQGTLALNGELQFTTANTIRGAGRLHITGEERLYLLNKSGVIVGKEWGGTGALTVQGDLQAGGAASVQGNLLVTGNVGIDATTPNSDLQIGNFEAQNRYLTLKVKGGNAYRAGVRLWAYQENYGYSIEFDERLATGNGLHIRTHSITAEEVSRVFVGLNGNVGIGTTAPPARLSVVAPGATEIAGTAHSAVLRTSAGALGATAGNETALSSTGLTVDKNHVSLGVRAIRTAKGTDWQSAAIGLGMDVDNTVRAGAALFLHANGNVGIGATSPNSDLQIGDFQARNRYLTLKVKGGNAYRAGVRLWAYQENYGYSIEFDERLATGNGLHIRTHSITAEEVSRVFVGLNGNVGIGTTTPEQKLTVNGELRFTGATTISSASRMHIFGEEILFLLNRGGVVVGKHWGGNGNLHVDGTFTQASDARLKQRIQQLESTLDKLTGIRGVSYLPRRVGAPSGPSEERPAIGVIAQELETVFPELVSTPGGQGYKGVDYGGLTAVLLEAVKDLKAALDPLQERVATLEAHA